MKLADMQTGGEYVTWEGTNYRRWVRRIRVDGFTELGRGARLVKATVLHPLTGEVEVRAGEPLTVELRSQEVRMLWPEWLYLEAQEKAARIAQDEAKVARIAANEGRLARVKAELEDRGLEALPTYWGREDAAEPSLDVPLSTIERWFNLR